MATGGGTGTPAAGTEFTYDLDTDIGKVRLAIGDTDAGDPEYADGEVQVFVTLAGSWALAAVLACDGLIAKYAQLVTIALGPRKEALSDIVEHYRALRENLAAGVGGTITTEDLAFGWTEEETSDSEYGA